jgi:hypothetical protein
MGLSTNLSADQPSEAGLPINLHVEQPSEAGLPTNLPAEQPIEAGLSTNLPAEPALRRTPLLKGRADLVLSSHISMMGHHRAMPRPWKRYQSVSIKHNARYVSPLTSGTRQP